MLNQKPDRGLYELEQEFKFNSMTRKEKRKAKKKNPLKEWQVVSIKSNLNLMRSIAAKMESVIDESNI